jgi:hypothetical protein
MNSRSNPSFPRPWLVPSGKGRLHPLLIIEMAFLAASHPYILALATVHGLLGGGQGVISRTAQNETQDIFRLASLHRVSAAR